MQQRAQTGTEPAPHAVGTTTSFYAAITGVTACPQKQVMLPVLRGSKISAAEDASPSSLTAFTCTFISMKKLKPERGMV